jgi:hypothetical protein
MHYKTVIGDSKIREFQLDLGSVMWPEFMQHDTIVNKNWPKLYSDFLNCQFALFDNEKLVGIGNAVHLNWRKPFEDLPVAGLDWAMEKAIDDFRIGIDSNLLIGVQILINSEYQSRGVSYQMLDIMKQVANANGLEHIALPVRPTLKYKYPLIPMDEYMNWENDEGLPFDPWLRVHIKSGGEIAKICENSMVISGSISEWEEWTGLRFCASGDYVVDKALTPIKVDKTNNIGKYIEPNVWILHKV